MERKNRMDTGTMQKRRKHRRKTHRLKEAQFFSQEEIYRRLPQLPENNTQETRQKHNNAARYVDKFLSGRARKRCIMYPWQNTPNKWTKKNGWKTLFPISFCARLQIGLPTSTLNRPGRISGFVFVLTES